MPAVVRVCRLSSLPPSVGAPIPYPQKIQNMRTPLAFVKKCGATAEHHLDSTTLAAHRLGVHKA